MQIIIVGCGKVGESLVERLSEEQEHNITVIDLRHALVQEISSKYDVMGVVGNGITKDTLDEAGVSTTDLLIAVTGMDEQNLLISLMAKKLGVLNTVVRVREPEYNKAGRFLKDEIGAAMVINPERAAANEIARVLRFPSAIKIDTFAKGRIEILQFCVEKGSVLSDMRVCEIVGKLDCDILVCGIERDAKAYIPGGNFIIEEGDKVSIIASIANATRFFKKIGLKTNRVKDTMIVGGGNMAYYLAEQLLETGTQVKIIEKDLDRCEFLCQALPKASVLHGDGTDNTLLLEEGLETAGSLVSLTNIDEENVLLSLYAQSITEGKIVTKINRIAYDDVITRLNLGTTIYPKNITAEYIIRFVRAMKNSMGSNIETLHMILDEKAEALEFHIREHSPVTNVTLEKMQLKENVLIACINRGNKVIIPRGQDVILPGDSVIVITLRASIKEITDILR